MVSLRISQQMWVLDLGEVRRLQTQEGPKLARYVVAARWEGPLGPRLLRVGVLPTQALVYPLMGDPLEFDQEGQTLRLPGLCVYLEGAPEFVETPWYVWVEPCASLA